MSTTTITQTLPDVATIDGDSIGATGASLADDILLSVAAATTVATVKSGSTTRNTRNASLPAPRPRAWSFGGRVD